MTKTEHARKLKKIERNRELRQFLYKCIRIILYRPVIWILGRHRIGHGVTRGVILGKSWVVKFPRLDYGMGMFLQGWLGNLEENKKWRAAQYLHIPGPHDQILPCEMLAPVKHCYLFGLILVMAKCEPITADEFLFLDQSLLVDGHEYYFSDIHPKNFGHYQGRIVCIDYGSS